MKWGESLLVELLDTSWVRWGHGLGMIKPLSGKRPLPSALLVITVWSFIVMQMYANLLTTGWRYLISQLKRPSRSRSCPLATHRRTASQSALRHLGSLCRRVSALCRLSVVLPAIPRPSAAFSTEPFAPRVDTLFPAINFHIQYVNLFRPCAFSWSI